MTISAIIARNEDGLTSVDNVLPWYLPEVSNIFESIANRNDYCIIGRKSAEVVPMPIHLRYKVLTSTPTIYDRKLGPQIKATRADIEFMNYANVRNFISNKRCLILGGNKTFHTFLEDVQLLHLIEVHVPYKFEYSLLPHTICNVDFNKQFTPTQILSYGKYTYIQLRRFCK